METQRPQHLSQSASDEVLSRLTTRKLAGTPRYEEIQIIGRGGMGAIVQVFDRDLRRSLAMKVVLQTDGHRSANATDVDPKRLGRFLEEAQVTAQLDHPGIVPVHELGLDDQGAVFFTMQLVKGRTLEEIYGLAKEGEEDWSQTRVLMILLKVCEAMAYAHQKGVIHRDLKPENVMVGRFGEVYVMDWGLARVDGATDRRAEDLSKTTMNMILSDRLELKERSGVESSLVTLDGDVIGTPAFMAPEQARGEIESFGPRTDVYSMGAMIYHLLTGTPPYVPEGRMMSAIAILRQVLAGPPASVIDLAPDTPLELIAICDKAMAREPDDRYADMSELGDDLRNYLEGRVVAAYGGGAWLELKKWVRRNKALAATAAAAVLIALSGLGAVGYVQAEGKKAERTQREIAEFEREKVMRLSAFQNLRNLETEADTLWPPTPDRVGDYEDWLARAGRLVGGLDQGPAADMPGHRAMLAELRERSTGRGSDGEYEFASVDTAWWHGQLERLITDIEAFADPETGLSSGISKRHGWGVERRLAFARTVDDLSIGDPRWADALRGIRGSDRYEGVDISPQRGLVPLGEDPNSGLWEFAQLGTGAIPERDEHGSLRIGEDTAIVFVLLPGGMFHMGAQSYDETYYNYDPEALPDEGPIHEVTLDPFFLSKYELTQAQWLRLTGENPSMYGPESAANLVIQYEFNLAHPVEQVSHRDALEVLQRLGLTLPTEAQWEYAARADAESPWWTGFEAESLEGTANFYDSFARRISTRTGVPCDDWLDDGFYIHAPVGSFEASPYGLHDVNGNVFEWALDPWKPYGNAVAAGTGAREGPSVDMGVIRGGAWDFYSLEARSARRNRARPEAQNPDIGVRPARVLDR